MKTKRMIFFILSILLCGITQNLIIAQSEVTQISIGQPIEDIVNNPVYNLFAIVTHDLVYIYDYDYALITTLSKTPGSSAQFSSVDWSPNGTKLVIDNDPDISIWNYDPQNTTFTQDTIILPLKAEYKYIDDMSWNSMGDKLATLYLFQPTGVNDLLGEIVIYATVDWSVSSIIQTTPIFPSRVIRWNPASTQIAFGEGYCPTIESLQNCNMPQAHIVDLTSGQVIWTEQYVDNIYDLAWSPNREYLAVSASEVSVYDVSTGTPTVMYIWQDLKSIDVYLNWKADSSKLMTVSLDGVVKILDISNMTEIQSFETLDFSNQVLSVAWNDESNLLYIGSDNGILYVWDVVNESQ